MVDHDSEPSFQLDNLTVPQSSSSFLPPSSHEQLQDKQRSDGETEDKEKQTLTHETNEQDETETIWETIFTWYLPLMFLWFRRSMFGAASLLQTILVGQCLRLVLAHCGELPKWVQPWFADPHAWPPPAFSVLALLTIVAFVVHPEGLTWFMMGKLRDVILSLLQSFATCWTMFIQDYGIFTTTIALMTLAGMGCLLAILLKHSMPKSKRRQATPEKHGHHHGGGGKNKKKKKGMRGKGGRLRQQARTAKPPIPENHVPTLIENDDDSSHQNVEDASSIASTSPSPSSNPPSESHEADTTSGVVDVRETITQQQDALHDVNTSMDSTTTSTTASATARTQNHSVSTVETDEFSCDSTSVKSISSTPATTDTSVSSKAKSKRSRKSKRSSKQKDEDSKQAPLKSKANRQADGSSRRSKPLIPATTGRFANLKEQDTRFDRNSSKPSQRLPRGSGGSKARPGRGNSSADNSCYTSPTHSATTPRSESSSAHTPIRETKFMGSSIQYGSPNSPQAPGTQKQELASFVSRAGLNDAAASLVAANLSDVDSLERLSDIQLQLYGVQAEEQATLHRLLHERRQVRPPPGLSSVHDEPPTLFSSPNRASEQQQRLVGQVHQQQQQQPAHQPPASSHMFGYEEKTEQDLPLEDHSESRIEAELQALGGQMVGSVLDF